MDHILYCHVKKDTKYLTAGDWFYHLGQDALCAQAYKHNKQWTLYISFERANKPLATDTYTFNTIEECKTFVANYFECPVEEVKTKDFPKPSL